MDTGSHKAYVGYLLEELRKAGVDDPRILDAFAAVPRHLFVDTWLEYDRTKWTPRQLADPASLRTVYSDTPLVLEVEGAFPVCSTSQPSLIGLVLRLLDLRPGMNVLEVGCGIGYSTALLARLVGPEGRVTGMDLDARAVARAREVHRRLGLATQIVTGDGYDGLAEAGPFDRIVAYAGLADVSPAWFEQLSPQGFILAPIDHCVDTPYFRIAPDGAGACVMWAGFIPARGRLGWTHLQPSPWPKGHAPDPGSPRVAEEAWQVDSKGF